MHHPPGAVMPASQPPNDRHDDRHLDPHAYNDMMAGHRRDGSESPPPLPIRPPSNKVTFHPVNKRAQESAVELARRQSSRRGPEDPRAHAVDMMRQESSKPSSSSRREEDLVRSSSHVSFHQIHFWSDLVMGSIFSEWSRGGLVRSGMILGIERTTAINIQTTINGRTRTKM